MNNSAASGPPCELNTNWTDIPDTLEGRLAASQYLVDVGLSGGPPEDIAYRLTVQLASERKASKDQYDLLSAEVARYRSRFLLERELCNDVIAENCDLEEDLKLAEAEADYSVSALITAQERLDNALATYDAIAPYINWNEITNELS